MTTEEILKNATPRPWQEGDFSDMFLDIYRRITNTYAVANGIQKPFPEPDAVDIPAAPLDEVCPQCGSDDLCDCEAVSKRVMVCANESCTECEFPVAVYGAEHSPEVLCQECYKPMEEIGSQGEAMKPEVVKVPAEATQEGYSLDLHLEHWVVVDGKTKREFLRRHYDGSFATAEQEAIRKWDLVNSYEADQELIRKLTEALGNVQCGECSHELKYHLDAYGCEIERGDGYRGQEFMEALGPCGCNLFRSYLKPERDIVVLLVQMREAAKVSTALSQAKGVKP